MGTKRRPVALTYGDAGEVPTPPRLTKTQQNIFRMLKDGRPHSRNAIKSLLPDDLAGDTAVTFHISVIRTRLDIQGCGYGIVPVQVQNSLHYQLIRFVGEVFSESIAN